MRLRRRPRGWNEHGEADPDAFGERRIDGWRPLPGLAYVCVVQVAAGGAQGNQRAPPQA